MTQFLARLPLPKEIAPLTLNLIVSAYIMALLNGTFWGRVSTVFAEQPFAMVAFCVAVFALTLFTLSALTLPYLHKPALALMIVIAAGSDHFQRAFGVLIDRDMIQNAMLTTVNESRHLFTVDMIARITLKGLIPAALVLMVRLKAPPLRHWLWRYPLAIALSLTLLAGALMSDFKTISAAVREHRDMMGSYLPGSTLAAGAKFAKLKLISAQITVSPLGRDATKGARIIAAQKPVLTVVFAGETARAQNWGLNGYARDTTPELRALEVVNYTDTASCGTSTAVSLPCMFSALPFDDYSQTKALAQENLMDILDHAGVAVDWIDNNTGDQGIAKRTGSTRLDATVDASACGRGECTDAVFLPILQKVMAEMTQDTVLVLHMIGSHGPAYFMRYPEDMETFQPACKSASFADCSVEEIVNAYDNSLRFTDHILAQSVQMMAAQDRVIPAMIYMSDHGESLGEGGLYLHAAPMFMAPETQRKVPFVIWLSQDYQSAIGVDQACLSARAQEPVSHDVLFHTVLGMMDIASETRQDALDLTAACKG